MPTSAGSSSSSEDVEVQAHDADIERHDPQRRPPTKRTRVSTSPQSRVKPAQPKKATRQPKKTLSLLPTMPLDIIFEILGFLAPRDLLTMAKTNTLFRRTLLSSQATTVWKSSRERVGGPACPSDFNEVEWALLLFGIVCQSCGTPHIRKIDFSIRRRVCASCKKKGVLAKSRFRTRFSGEDNSVLELLPSTSDNGDSMHSFHSKRGCNYYWIADIDNMLRRLSVLQANIMRGLPNAAENLETFKAERKQLVKNIKDDVPRLNAWKHKVAGQRIQDIYNTKEKRKRDILDRMMQLGYLREELTTVELDPECRKSTELTERIWQRIRPGLEAKASTAREIRLIRERESLFMQRRRIVAFCYDAYKATLLPSQWTYLPRVLDICNFECFKTLIEADVDVDLRPEDFSGCMEMLPELLETRMEELRTSLRESMRAAINSATSASTSTPATPPDNLTPDADLLDLATATFYCQRECWRHRGTHSARLTIGWNTIATHHCDYEDEGVGVVIRSEPYLPNTLGEADVESQRPRFVFNTKAAIVAQDLVRCAGLGENALASEMDAKNLRFDCKLCGIKQGSSMHYRVGFGWRDAVYHTTNVHSKNISSPFDGWKVLPEDETAKVMEREREDTKWRCAFYTCNHCSTYLNTKGVEEEVKVHVQTMHGIEDPLNPDDYFYFERYRLLLDDKSRWYAVPAPDTLNEP
ncbi:hypothetical protein BJ912DRAFT_925078 [Pholiota molesta]|nr:hypothetical protein BJ912DRAFT_925078 [Pholiota molesta]